MLQIYCQTNKLSKHFFKQTYFLNIPFITYTFCQPECYFLYLRFGQKYKTEKRGELKDQLCFRQQQLNMIDPNIGQQGTITTPALHHSNKHKDLSFSNIFTVILHYRSAVMLFYSDDKIEKYLFSELSQESKHWHCYTDLAIICVFSVTNIDIYCQWSR